MLADDVRLAVVVTDVEVTNGRATGIVTAQGAIPAEQVLLATNVWASVLPEKLGLKIPMYASFQRNTVTPEFDPKDPDIPLEQTLNSFGNQDSEDEYLEIVRDRTTRRSLNFTNVRKVKTKPDAKNHIYDIENFSFTYAYSDINTSNFKSES